MCLYPTLIENRKYKPNLKNKGKPPKIKDERTKYVPIGCGVCMECMKKKAREWQVRLHEEIRTNNTGKFVTLSFSNKTLIETEKEVNRIRLNTIKKLNKLENKRYNRKFEKLEGYKLDNEIATLCVRRFLERWRKKYKKSVRHWLVTEIGQKNTERIHIHGIIWTNNKSEIKNIWQYGHVFIGDYVNEKTINYIIKYIHKTDQIHKYYKPKILTSSGIGNNYINRPDSKRNTFNNKDTNELYITKSRIKLPLPIYYRNKIYTDEEKEILWLNLLDKNKRYINGIEVDISLNEDDYYKLLKQHRIINDQFGYGNDQDWKQKEYEKARRNLKKLEIINKSNKLA